jgi:glycosyltransferase involved in cell wall biosynthesis
MVSPGEADALAAKIQQVLTDPSRMARMSRRNLTRAHDYGEETLHARCVEFYRQLRTRTEQWIAQSTAATAVLPSSS